MVNGLDLSHCSEGDVVEVVGSDGAMLIAEGWTEATDQHDVVSCHPKRAERAVADDAGYLGWRKTSKRHPQEWQPSAMLWTGREQEH